MSKDEHGRIKPTYHVIIKRIKNIIVVLRVAYQTIKKYCHFCGVILFIYLFCIECLWNNFM